jgi:hypothetical protein
MATKSKWREMLKAARRRQRNDYFYGFIHAYCDNHRCTGRSFQIQIKTYGADDPVTVDCPLCGVAAIPDHRHGWSVETMAEHEKRIARHRQIKKRIKYIQRMDQVDE